MLAEVVTVEEAVSASDGEDFDAFARRVHPRLVSAVELYCGDLAVAEDAAQDALVKALLRWDRVRDTASPDAYVMRIAMNAATGWYRRLAIRRRSVARIVPPPPPSDPTDALAVRAALALLPPRQRQAVVLRYFGGYSVAESAVAMACAEGTVRALTSQAIDGLRRRLDFELKDDLDAE